MSVRQLGINPNRLLQVENDRLIRENLRLRRERDGALDELSETRIELADARRRLEPRAETRSPATAPVSPVSTATPANARPVERSVVVTPETYLDADDSVARFSLLELD